MMRTPFVRHFHLIICGILMAGLCACSNARDKLGLTKTAPDEFTVVKRAPLAMPPDYNLRPPEPGAPRPQEQTTSATAQQAVFGHDTSSYTPTESSAENTLLQQAGANQADPNIRRRVDSETAEVDNSKKPVVDRLLGLGGLGSEEDGNVIDPKAEAERLKNQQAVQGRPDESGEPPIIVKE